MKTVSLTVNLQRPARKLTRNCLSFSSEHGVQELFHVQEDFEDAIKDLELPVDEIDKKWQMVLAHRPRQKWNSMWHNNRLADVPRTNF